MEVSAESWNQVAQVIDLVLDDYMVIEPADECLKMFSGDELFMLLLPNKSPSHQEALSVAGLDPLIHNTPEAEEGRR